ncbi:hypothetical protein SBF1_8460003 [Candidatus Desulfosporosinus infrequens]|uniref:Uncharacterized protein n=1 Tax=Candidatus Desulfosporosinus infrequens TaxID=2043169 RepID=A0A2U3LUZ8_9FIRM|nr:hypothetical protein SBF1_8460003 [Candidatus Desulfosporosinus infrequens]
MHLILRRLSLNATTHYLKLYQKGPFMDEKLAFQMGHISKYLG